MILESYTYKYPRPAVTVDCCIFAFHENELSVLLIRRGIAPFKDSWALPGGFMRMDETAEEAAIRELFEETGFETNRLRQFHTYTSIYRDPRERIVTICYYTLAQIQAVKGGDDAAEARWFPVAELPPLAFDHEDIVRDALEAMKRDVYFEPIGFELLPEVFSMNELQKIIESITGVTYDRRNFYNKMRHQGFVSEIRDKDMHKPKARLNISLPAEDIMDEGCCMSTMPSFSSPVCMPGNGDEEDDVDFFSCTKEIRECHTLGEEETPAPKARRSGVKYTFNAFEFLKRKNKKGSAPITY